MPHLTPQGGVTRVAAKGPYLLGGPLVRAEVPQAAPHVAQVDAGGEERRVDLREVRQVSAVLRDVLKQRSDVRT